METLVQSAPPIVTFVVTLSLFMTNPEATMAIRAPPAMVPLFGAIELMLPGVGIAVMFAVAV